MKEQLYFVYGITKDHEQTDKFVAKESTLDDVIEYVKRVYDIQKVYVNKADFGYLGFLVQQKYVGNF